MFYSSLLRNSSSFSSPLCRNLSLQGSFISPLSVRPWVLLMQWLVLGRWAEKWQETANAKAVIVCSCDLNPFLAIHHFLQYGLHNLHPLGTEMCWGKQRVPKVTTGTLSAPALPFTPILADRANEEEMKSYFAWVLVMQWLFEHKDFSSGLVFRYRRQEQMKETHQWKDPSWLCTFSLLACVASEPENTGLLGACLKTNPRVILPARDQKSITNLQYKGRHGSNQKSWHNSISLQ